MTQELSNYATNNSQQANLNNSLVTSVSKSTSKKVTALTQNLYLGPGSTQTPALTNLIFTPIEIYHSARAFLEAYRIRDREGMIENSLRIIQSPFSLLNSSLQLSDCLMRLGIFFHDLSGTFKTTFIPLPNHQAHLGPALGGTSFAICLIQGLLETLGLLRTSAFCKKYICSKAGERDKEKIYTQCLNALKKKYFEVSPKRAEKIDKYIRKNLSNLTDRQVRKAHIMEAQLREKKNNLTRRVQHRLAHEIEQKLPYLLENLQNPSALKVAEELLDEIDIQTKKNRLFHILGLAAIVFTGIGLILGSIACPYAIPLVLLSIGFALAFSRQLLHDGMSETKGWNFDYDGSLITRIGKAIYKLFNPTPEQGPVLHFALSSPQHFSSILRARHRRHDSHLRIRVCR